MPALRTLSPALLGLALLAQPAAAQTTPTKHRVQHMPAAKPAPRMVPNTSPAARAADPLRGTNSNGQGNNVYAAPGEPVNVTDNGKNTPPYDGSAPKGAARTRTTLASPK
ncbi:hypothetical protein GCM10023172_24670 [Hymenobacter ginsengisoli]|uniref:Serine/threonine protein kinase n=1 Tax=Hymenobacter ginsengisoli TaxID=1051626 RepID=A0ABP8QHV0_9BACT|nr:MULTISPECIES: hypothetical protein [unclassified Hymenobacter]MBO2030274.1 hypothetical protein [Hymenobacter sp. BT559]